MLTIAKRKVRPFSLQGLTLVVDGVLKWRIEVGLQYWVISQPNGANGLKRQNRWVWISGLFTGL